jgi:glucose/arabinose dehydrogenase
MFNLGRSAAAVLTVVLGAPSLCAAQGVRYAPVSLTEKEYVFDTAEQPRIRVTVVVKGLVHPWSVALLPSGDALISERGAALRFVANAVGADATLVPDPVVGLPALVAARMKGGLHDVVLHPQFARNQLVYLTFNRAGEATNGAPIILTLLRGKLVEQDLTEVKEIYAGPLQSPTGSRIAFGNDRKLYIATGVNFYDPQSQQLGSANGKVLRLNDDGTPASDNPFVGREGVLPELFSYGHSTQYGLTAHPTTGDIFSIENGSNGGDELNRILPGRNYGWPTVSFGRHYDGRPFSESPVAEGVERPMMFWVPSMTPSGLVFYTGDRFPAWKGNMFFGVIRRGEISGTGGLERVVFNEQFGEIRSESLLTELRQRIRDVRQGPDGLLYLLTDEADGALLRVEPAAATD